MDLNSKMDCITKGTLEVVSLDELKNKLEKNDLTAYIGYEPSGKVHLGHAITVKKMLNLQDAGIKVKILLADLHAYLNGKGSLEEIREVSEYNMDCFRALGLSDDTEFILGSSFQTHEDYSLLVYQLAISTTLNRAKRSMAQITRNAEEHHVAEVIYPLMQVVDMLFLKVDIAVGGMEQRKIHMLARDNLPRLGYPSPVCIHTPLLHGTDGAEKMSSSKENFIAIDDEPQVIREKIKKSFCPSGEVEGNPVLEIAEHFIYTERESLIFPRPEKFGGDLDLTKDELREIYQEGALHPLDLKNGVAEALIETLEPVRDYFDQNSV